MSAKTGDKVKVHYTGKLPDGTVFDSSREREEPFAFTLGEGQVIPGFESAVEGMEVGEQRTEILQAESAYGERRDDLLFRVERENFPDNVEPKVGMPLELQQSDGKRARLTVSEVGEEAVTLDANHPLAGQELTFEIELVEIVG